MDFYLPKKQSNKIIKGGRENLKQTSTKRVVWFRALSHNPEIMTLSWNQESNS